MSDRSSLAHRLACDSRLADRAGKLTEQLPIRPRPVGQLGIDSDGSGAPQIRHPSAHRQSLQFSTIALLPVQDRSGRLAR